MSYCSIRDLRNVKKENLDLVNKAVRQAKAMISFNQMREKAQNSGFMSDEEINDEINRTREKLN